MDNITNERLFSKETLVPRPRESETIKFGIEHVDMVQIFNMKR